MMKNTLIPVLAIAAASVAVPAAAQNFYGPARGPVYGPQHGLWQSMNTRKYNLDRRIEQGVRQGLLSRREARNLDAQFDSLVRLERSYMRGGLTAWERGDLNRRYERLSFQIRVERNDRDNRRW